MAGFLKLSGVQDFINLRRKFVEIKHVLLFFSPTYHVGLISRSKYVCQHYFTISLMSLHNTIRTLQRMKVTNICVVLRKRYFSQTLGHGFANIRSHANCMWFQNKKVHRQLYSTVSEVSSLLILNVFTFILRARNRVPHFIK